VFQRSLRQLLAALADAAGITDRFRIHDLWHTAAALMIQAGYPPKMLQEILGHASITTTLDLYGHLYPGDMDKYADRLDDAAADATGKAKTRPEDERRPGRIMTGPSTCGNCGALGGTRTPNLLIRRCMCLGCCSRLLYAPSCPSEGRRSWPRVGERTVAGLPGREDEQSVTSGNGATPKMCLPGSRKGNTIGWSLGFLLTV